MLVHISWLKSIPAGTSLWQPLSRFLRPYPSSGTEGMNACSSHQPALSLLFTQSQGRGHDHGATDTQPGSSHLCNLCKKTPHQHAHRPTHSTVLISKTPFLVTPYCVTLTMRTITGKTVSPALSTP